MKKKYIFLLVVLIVEIVIAIVIAKTFFNNENTNFSEFTDVEVNTNTLWCSTFQLAWNELIENLSLEKIEFEDYPNSEIIDNLNKKSFTKDMINPKDYSIFVEKNSPQVLEKIKDYNITDYHLEKLKNNTSNGLVILASLNKEFNFPEEFKIYDGVRKFNENVDGVTYFGLKGNDNSIYKDSVEVLYYYDANTFDFGIKLKTTTTDEVIMCTLEEEKYNTNFEDLYQEIVTSSENYSGNSNLEDIDSFFAPNINIQKNINYNSLCWKEIKNSNGNFLSLASQYISLNMNNEGAKLESEFLAVSDYVGSQPTTARKFHYNVPFVLFLKEENQDKPYFAVKIIDSSFLDIKE